MIMELNREGFTICHRMHVNWGRLDPWFCFLSIWQYRWITVIWSEKFFSFISFPHGRSISKMSRIDCAIALKMLSGFGCNRVDGRLFRYRLTPRAKETSLSMSKFRTKLFQQILIKVCSEKDEGERKGRCLIVTWKDPLSMSSGYHRTIYFYLLMLVKTQDVDKHNEAAIDQVSRCNRLAQF